MAVMRYTKTFLRHQVDVINGMLGHDPENVTGETPRAILLYSAYGGYGVHYVHSSGRGRHTLSACYSARETARFLDGMIKAIELVQGQR